MSELARSLGVLLLAGSLPLLDNGQDRVSSASVLFGPDGSTLARYDKMHLFDIDVPQSGERHRESDDFLAGRAPVCVRTPLASIGLSICYDLRFPELYRTLMREGAEILTVPAAFTEATGRAHWHVLLRSRAIENQCFVIAPNQGGAHPDGKRTFGHSLVVNPWGEIIAEAGMGEDVVIADLKLGELRDLRARFPVLQHRRL